MADVISAELLEQYRKFEPIRYRALAAMIDAGEIEIEGMEQEQTASARTSRSPGAGGNGKP